jgi:hypothetical protein
MAKNDGIGIAEISALVAVVSAVAIATRSIGLRRVLCWFPLGARKRALKSVLKEFGYTQSLVARFSGYLFAIPIVIVGVIAFIVLAALLPVLFGGDPIVLFGWELIKDAKNLSRDEVTPIVSPILTAFVAAIVGGGTLLIGFYQWWKARSEIALDKFYERLAATNDKRVDWWSGPRQDARLNVDDYRTQMYIHLELDNLEYSIQKYQIGWMSAENAYSTLRTFCQRCLESQFRKEAKKLVENNIGYHHQTRTVVEQAQAWANDPFVWYENKGLKEPMNKIDRGWEEVLAEARYARRWIQYR